MEFVLRLELASVLRYRVSVLVIRWWDVTHLGAACLQSKDWFLIWIGSDQEKTFGKTIAGLIENGIEPERRILWDTKKLKRPNTMKLLKDTFDSFGAEGEPLFRAGS